jgi:hypothetical protein
MRLPIVGVNLVAPRRSDAHMIAREGFTPNETL